eukprot:g5999.t1
MDSQTGATAEDVGAGTGAADSSFDVDGGDVMSPVGEDDVSDGGEQVSGGTPGIDRSELSADQLVEELEEALSVVEQLQARNRQWRQRVLDMKREGIEKDGSIALLQERVRGLEGRLALAFLAQAPAAPGAVMSGGA